MSEMPTGALVRLQRIHRRMSTVALATRAGITVRYLEMIEADSKTPSLPVLRRLARALGVRTSFLVGEPPSEDHEGPVNPRLDRLERALYTYRSLTVDVPSSPTRPNSRRPTCLRLTKTEGLRFAEQALQRSREVRSFAACPCCGRG